MWHYCFSAKCSTMLVDNDRKKFCSTILHSYLSRPKLRLPCTCKPRNDANMAWTTVVRVLQWHPHLPAKSLTCHVPTAVHGDKCESCNVEMKTHPSVSASTFQGMSSSSDANFSAFYPLVSAVKSSTSVHTVMRGCFQGSESIIGFLFQAHSLLHTSASSRENLGLLTLLLPKMVLCLCSTHKKQCDIAQRVAAVLFHALAARSRRSS